MANVQHKSLIDTDLHASERENAGFPGGSVNGIKGQICKDTNTGLRFINTDGTASSPTTNWELLKSLNIWSIANRPWTKYNSNPIKTPVDGFLCTVFYDTAYSKFVMYYQKDYSGSRAIWRAESSNGLSGWSDVPATPILVKSGSGCEADYLNVPNVWKESASDYRMIYGCNDSGNPGGQNRRRGSYATSTDGKIWTKHSSTTPVLDVGGSGDWDEYDCEPVGIIKVGSTYYLWYNSMYRPGYNEIRKYGFATSTDCINWTKDVNNPIFISDRFSGCPFKVDDIYYIIVVHYTSGHDYEVFELYACEDPKFYTSNRIFLRNTTRWGASGTWEDQDIDAPAVMKDDGDPTYSSYDRTEGVVWIYYGGWDTSNIGCGLITIPY